MLYLSDYCLPIPLYSNVRLKKIPKTQNNKENNFLVVGTNLIKY